MGPKNMVTLAFIYFFKDHVIISHKGLMGPNESPIADPLVDTLVDPMVGPKVFPVVDPMVDPVVGNPQGFQEGA